MPTDGPRDELVSAVRAALEQAGDPSRAEAMQRYMKSALPYYGVSSPALKAALTPVLRDPSLAVSSRAEWVATILALWSGATHREEWYAAVSLGRLRAHREWVDSGSMPLWERLIREGAWWDIVDDVATHLVRDTLLAAPAVEGRRMREWSVSDSLWLRRASIICQVGAKERVDEALLNDVIEANVEDPDFFIRKAIGWALRDHARTAPEWVRAFVRAHPALSGLSRREALRHVGPLEPVG